MNDFSTMMNGVFEFLQVRKKSKAKLVHLPPTQFLPLTSTESLEQKNDTEKDV